MMTWQDEARGIEPWAGAMLFHPFTRIYRMVVRVGPESWAVEGGYDPTAIQDGRPESMRAAGWVVALDVADTCAAFDRRLALRLGAPEEAVREGVVVLAAPPTDPRWSAPSGTQVFADTDTALVCAGRLVRRHDGHREHTWWKRVVLDVGTDDPLLARVRAWNSVKP